ncbi:MAG: sensor histidine kinase [Flammeovirgaceae bacterium]|nr:sensor histidine kinase [Flammeovirgaceae bacterium]
MKKLLLIIFAFVSCNSMAQVALNIDSLLKKIDASREDSNKVKLYYAAANHYIKIDLNEAEKFCQKGAELSKKINYRQGMADYFTNYSSVLNFRGDFDATLKIDLEAVDYAKQYADSSELARTMLNVGIAHKQLENYEAAVYYIERAKNLLIKNNDHRYDGNTFNLLQSLYYSMHQYRKGVGSGLNAIKALEKTDDKESLGQAYNNLGLNYLYLQSYDSAKYYLSKAVTEAQKNGDIVIQITTNLNFAQIALNQGQYDSIKLYANKALTLSKKYGAHEFEGLAQYGLAYHYLLKKDYSRSALFADSAMRLANRFTMPYLKQKMYGLLSSLHYARQNTTLGYYYFNQYEMLNDSVLNTSITNSTIHIEKKFETERKDAKIKLQQIQLNQKILVNYFLIGGAVTLVIILLLTYRNYQARQKLQQTKIDELETEKRLTAAEAVLKGEEQERTRLAKDLHDGLGGMLSGIKFSLNNVKENLVMTPDNAHAFERSIDMLDSSIQEMRRVAHNMMPELLLKYGLDVALKEYCAEIERSGVMHTTYQSINMDKIAISQSAAVTIYRIVQELSNNAIKHANATEILVQAHVSEQEKLLTITVEDNGKGFDPAILKQSLGMGWSNIQNRVEFLKGKIDVSSEKGKGTSVLIEVNI